MVGGPRERQASERRLKAFCGELDRRLTPCDFSVDVEADELPSETLPAAKVASALRKKMAELDPDAVKLAIDQQGFGAVPTHEARLKGCMIVLKLWPKPREARHDPQTQTVGGIIGPIEEIDCRRSLRNRLREKARTCGKAEEPYVIAVNVAEQTFDVDEQDVMDVLFGTVRHTYHVRARRHSAKRVPDGVWARPPGSENRSVSAVLLASRLDPWNIMAQDVELWHNPWARKPLRAGLWQGKQRLPNSKTGQMVTRGGQSAAEVLGLSPRPAQAERAKERDP